MKKKTAIVTDSNSGITQAQAKELGIFVLPMPFFINEEKARDHEQARNCDEQICSDRQK